MLISWDIEIAKPIPSTTCPSCGGFAATDVDLNGQPLDKGQVRCIDCNHMGDMYVDFRTDWMNHAPLGISCAAAARKDEKGGYVTKFWQADEDKLAMSDEQCVAMLLEMEQWAAAGHTIVTWNGLSFDFAVLANETGLKERCASLALGHVDMMFLSVAIRGYRLGLDAALAGAGVQSKLHEVTLTTGEVIEDMSGARAPELWQLGERKAVLAYLGIDVSSTVELAHRLTNYRRLKWTSRAGRPNSFGFPLIGGKIPSVLDCLKMKEPYTGWMPNPIPRSEYTAWINKED